MDTGYANLIDNATREEALARTTQILQGSPFIAGAFVADASGADFRIDDYARSIGQIEDSGGTPIIFQSYGLIALEGDRLIEAYDAMARRSSAFYLFELGTMFAPFGRIYKREEFQKLLQIPSAIGIKHSSLSREIEWERIAMRDQVRPDFRILTGNDLAIDMVMYGSDYLLGLSTFAPDAFAKRDRFWELNDPAFHELNDLLQYLGRFAFRDPVPAYKHSAAMFLKLRGWLKTDRCHPRSMQRPESDRPILQAIWEQLREWTEGGPS
jgi:hypothetical protein